MNILLTGGSACGKSTFAEKLAVALPAPRIYLATMMPYQADGALRIARHRAQRADKGFAATIERYTDIRGAEIPSGATVLLDCLCNLVANEMYEPDGAGADAADAVLEGIDRIAKTAGNLIVVTNTVGCDGATYADSVLAYVRTLGGINNRIAQQFNCVCELCCGIPILLKGELPV